jgi:hypothetical protein
MMGSSSWPVYSKSSDSSRRLMFPKERERSKDCAGSLMVIRAFLSGELAEGGKVEEMEEDGGEEKSEEEDDEEKGDRNVADG